MIEVSVRKDTTTPLRVRDVQLVSDSFATLAPTRVDTTLGKTPRTDLRIPYGEARCDPARIPPVRPGFVVANIQVGGEPFHEVRFALPHPDRMLSALVAAECGAFLLRQSVDVTFGDSWTPAGKGARQALHGMMTVTRKSGDEPIVVDDLGGTTHYNVKPLSGRRKPVIELPPGSNAAKIPVEITPTRCDPHAFAEAKKAYLFPVWAKVGGGEIRWLIATPSPAAQATFLSYARTTCGF
jgi:hypothetical protein